MFLRTERTTDHWNSLFIQHTRLCYLSLSLPLWDMWFGC
nr:MAG TPA: hypothetical protein [Caudoviricetes sp.]